VLGFLPVATRLVSVSRRTAVSFNPVLGFLPVATAPSTLPWTATRPFQSRAGFSARRDDEYNRHLDGEIVEFQSRAGFSARRDRWRRAITRGATTVSIPCWVFCPSRPHSVQVSGKRFCRFNPVLGFLPVATSSIIFVEP